MKNYKFLILTLFVFSLSFGSISCDKDLESQDELEQSIAFDKDSSTLIVGEELVLNANFGSNTSPKRTYQWNTDNPEVVSISPSTDYSATIEAKVAGTTTVSLASTDGVLIAVCTITVKDAPVFVEDGVVRILAIGNSFSSDGVESYLYELVKKEGIPVVIGNLIVAASALDFHWQNASGNIPAYEYWKRGQNGSISRTPSVSIETALADEPWDYISFQQVSRNSGQYETYVTPLPLLLNYVKSKATHPNVKYILHQTWAYAQNTTHDGFLNYNSDQITMYNAIVDATARAKDLVDMDILIPVGTAIQNGRTSVIGDNFTRDGYHLDVKIGRYTAACTWFEAITGINVIGNAYKPATISDYHIEIAQNAAHTAITKPNEITEMVDYK